MCALRSLFGRSFSPLGPTVLGLLLFGALLTPGKGAFYPPPADVAQSLAEFALYPKTKSFTGYHATLDLKPSNGVSNVYGGTVTPEWVALKRQQFLANGAVPDAAWVNYWIGKSDDAIYGLLLAETPRGLVPNYDGGYPLHQGSIQSFKPIWGQPNQFLSTVDGTIWGPGVTVTNPGTGQPVEIIDEGNGWVPPVGFPIRTAFKFKAAYREYLVRKLIFFPYVGDSGFDGPAGSHASPLYALAVAYAVTHDQRYADRVLLILNRLAEFYRYGTSVSEHGNDYSAYPYRAYLDDHNFECAMIANMALSYDLVWDALPTAGGVINYFATKGNADYKGDGGITTEDLRYNIERNLFGYTWEFLKRAAVGAGGNMALRQAQTRIQIASVFQNDAIIDFVLDGPRGFKDVAVGTFYRDGAYHEDSSSYLQVGNDMLLGMAGMLKQYQGRAEYQNGVTFPPDIESLLSAVETWPDRWTCDGRPVTFGDAGNGRQKTLDLAPRTLKTELGHEIGLSLLRQGETPQTRQHVLFYHGNAGSGHGHLHQLMFKILAYGYDFSADLGYPMNLRVAKAIEMTKATITHPTVLVDKKSQEEASVASSGIFVNESGVQAASAYSLNAYPGIPVYHRTVIAIDAGSNQRFVADIFRVTGGSVHDYPVHSLSGPAGDNFSLSPNLSLTPQGGTMAGVNVPYRTNGYSGYAYLNSVKRGVTPLGFTATWETGDANGAGYKVCVPAGFDGEVYTAKGENEGVIDQSPLDAYLILRRSGTAPLSSSFVTVQEAFQGNSLGLSVERVSPGSAFNASQQPVAFVVTAQNGRKWHIVSALAGPPSVYENGGREFLQVTTPTGNVTVNAPSQPGVPNPIAGKVIAVDYPHNKVTLGTGENLAERVGKVVYFRNPAYVKTTSFEIKSAVRLSAERWEIELAQPPLLARGRVQQIDQGVGGFRETLATEKSAYQVLDGKPLVLTSSPAQIHRIATTEIKPLAVGGREQVTHLANPADLDAFQTGAAYSVYEFAPGDDWYICRDSATLINFESAGGYGAGNLLGQPQGASGTHWSGAAGANAGLIKVAAGSGIAGTQGIKAEAAEAGSPYTNSIYRFAPSNADLKGVFAPGSSVLDVSFQLQWAAVNGGPTGVGRFYASVPPTLGSAVEGLSLDWYANGKIGFNDGAFRYVSNAAGTGDFVAAPGVFYSVRALIDYATRTYTLEVGGIRQNRNGNDHLSFRNPNGVNKNPIVEIQTGNNKSSSFRAWSIDDLNLLLVP